MIRDIYEEVFDSIRRKLPEYFKAFEKKVEAHDLFSAVGFQREDSPEYCEALITHIQAHRNEQLYQRMCMEVGDRRSLEELEARSMASLRNHYEVIKGWCVHWSLRDILQAALHGHLDGLPADTVGLLWDFQDWLGKSRGNN